MIICCGEALIDMIPVTQSDGTTLLNPACGGAVFNTAVALGRLNSQVGFFSGISNDLFGKKLSQELIQSGVDTSHIVYSDRPTTLAFVELDNGQASYIFYDENTAGRSLSHDDLPTDISSGQAYFFGGISLISEPCASTYEYLMRGVATQKVVMLDPNIRPAFIEDENKYRTRLDRLFKCADILKISDEDLSWILNEKSEEEAIISFFKKGLSIVIVTRGAEGACLFTPNFTMSAKPKVSVKATNTVGAGDTFNAGFLASLADAGLLDKAKLSSLKQDLLYKALEDGVAVASKVVQSKGTK